MCVALKHIWHSVIKLRKIISKPCTHTDRFNCERICVVGPFVMGTRLTESGNYPFKMNKIILTACYMKAHECLHVGTGVSDI
jgi:hypothetical protein